ncbi:TonB-dependent siderophore receptor [Novosphingobium profundi]|uniref:TonB-dependent siderophore receptor n=1 Tax=Novosphingobium profundi TaxID=1774954 RepID=UPI001BDAB77F|nr:TonB-dependent siderophore receptor [Novosphingobium profundi]MBT0668506.1 TonB-dependent siderophore receptor [Novosphingobium profundi]
MKTTATALGLVLAALASPAFADDNAAAANSAADSGDRIIVTATGYSSATSTTKTDSPIIESPQAISIISAEEIDLRASPNIADALAYTAGVQAEPSGQDSRTDEISVRGFGAGGFSSNNSFVDGLRLPTGGQWTRTGFDTFALQQIEVLKGPSGALYGQTAPGGVVNLVTKKPTDSFQAQFMLQAIGTTDLGNWNYEAAADVSGPITSTLSGRVVALSRYGGTQIDGVDQGRQYISPSLTWKPDTDTTWTLLGQYQRDEGGSTFQFLPSTGSLYASNGKYIANDAFIGEPDWNTFDRNQYLAASFFEHRFGTSGLTLRNNTRYTHIDTLYRAVVLSGDTYTTCPSTISGCIAGQTIGRRAVQGDGWSDGWATDTQLQFDTTTGSVEHTLLAGVDYFHTDWTHYRDLVTSSLVLPVLDIFDPQSRGSDGFADNLNAQVYSSSVSKQTGVYLQDQISAGNLHVTLGGRYDWAKTSTTDLTDLSSFTNKDDKFTWRAGAVYLFDSGLAFYASYAQSFLPDTTDPDSTLGGEPFEALTGDQYEAGIRYQSGDSLYLTLGAYQITQQNMSTPDPSGTLCGSRTCYVQTGEGRVRGIEFEGKGSLPWGTAVIAALTYTDSEVTKDNTTYTVDGETLSVVGNKLAQVPDWMASLFVNHTFRGGALEGLSLGGGVRYTGVSYGTTTNVLEIPDYTLYDAFVRYDFGNGVRASINGRNIADKRYVATCTAASACYYGQGRSVTARVDFRW